MLEIVMLYIALSVTEPNGNKMDEEIRVMSKHFDTEEECQEFMYTWEYFIKSEGLNAARSLLKDGYEAKIIELGCTIVK